MSNSIQAIIPRPEGMYLCIWNERILMRTLNYNSADTILGNVALNDISKEEIIGFGVYPSLYEIWNGLVKNNRSIRKPIIFNLYDNLIEYDGQHFVLKDDHNSVMRDIESLGNIYY